MVTLTQGETLTVSAEDADAVSLLFKYGGPQKGEHAMPGSAGEGYAVNVATDSLTPGNYLGNVWATYPGPRKVIIKKVAFTIKAELQDGADGRSENRKAYDAITAFLAGRASDGVKSYVIAGRELSRYELSELRSLRKMFAQAVRKEEGTTGNGRIIFIG